MLLGPVAIFCTRICHLISKRLLHFSLGFRRNFSFLRLKLEKLTRFIAAPTKLDLTVSIVERAVIILQTMLAQQLKRRSPFLNKFRDFIGIFRA